MRLNGVKAEPGTIIGMEKESFRFVAVDNVDIEGVELRYAKAEEVTREAFNHEPRSVAEHYAIPRRMSPYGLIRQFGAK